MAEFTARVWRKKISSIPLMGSRSPKEGEVSVEASDVHSALDRILRSERLEYPADRFYIYIQIETDLGPRGLGDIELIDLFSEHPSNRKTER